MPSPRILIPGLLLLCACSEGPTAPDRTAPEPAVAAAAREQGGTATCVVTGSFLSYEVTISWTRTKVRNVWLESENGTQVVNLDRPRRRGTVVIAPTSAPLGFRLDDGVQDVAQGGCTAG